MDELLFGNLWYLFSDIGLVIDQVVFDIIDVYVVIVEVEGCLFYCLLVFEIGLFVVLMLIKIDSIYDLQKEVFGFILYVVIFKFDDLNKVIDDINVIGYGLMFGFYMWIDDCV